VAVDFDDVTLGTRGPDPRQLGTCRIEARVAAGAGSRIYRAVDLSLGRTVAVKLMNPVDDENDAGAPSRFLAAGDALAGLELPNVVQVIRTGSEGNLRYIVYEYVDGEDLDRAVRRERALVPAAAARAILDAAQGLAAGLERGLVHGDVRPRHLIRARGETKVTGFQLSPLYVTAQGRRLRGHPAYVAPEIAGNGVADHRADIYSLGCTLFHVVTGRTPYGQAGADALVACHVHEPFPTLASTGARVPDELEQFLLRLTARQPSKRFASYADLLQAGAAMLPALRRLVPHEPSLIVEDGRQQGLRVNIPEGDFLLGRTPGEGIEIDDARISRRHAMIKRSGEYLEVEDLGSRNGIRVNGAEVRSRQLFPGDRIEIGDTVLRLDGPAPAVHQTPVVPASPVRGAFGDVEITHPPGKQASPDSLTGEKGGAVLARLAPLLARSTTPEDRGNLEADVLGLAADVLGADDQAFIRIQNGEPVFEAATSRQAQVLSCLLPAIERALPGQLALATAVRVGRDDRWGVAIAPVLRNGEVTALLALTKTNGRFDESSLNALEACCALLSMRG
jgi:hypothetical protein